MLCRIQAIFLIIYLILCYNLPVYLYSILFQFIQCPFGQRTQTRSGSFGCGMYSEAPTGITTRRWSRALTVEHQSPPVSRPSQKPAGSRNLVTHCGANRMCNGLATPQPLHTINWCCLLLLDRGLQWQLLRSPPFRFHSQAWNISAPCPPL